MISYAYKYQRLVCIYLYCRYESNAIDNKTKLEMISSILQQHREIPTGVSNNDAVEREEPDDDVRDIVGQISDTVCQF